MITSNLNIFYLISADNAPQALSGLSRFALYSNAAIPGHDNRIQSGVTAERCAELCQRETEFVCRSFDYKSQGRVCALSDKNSRDVDPNFSIPGNRFDYYERIDIGGYCMGSMMVGVICQIYTCIYTLSHPENDRDVTERAQGYTLQDASLMRQSRCSFLNA